MYSRFCDKNIHLFVNLRRHHEAGELEFQPEWEDNSLFTHTHTHAAERVYFLHGKGWSPKL